LLKDVQTSTASGVQREHSSLRAHGRRAHWPHATHNPDRHRPSSRCL